MYRLPVIPMATASPTSRVTDRDRWYIPDPLCTFGTCGYCDRLRTLDHPNH